jgi:gamma-glutamyltranspeptidase / glutathione hydrolase
MRRRSFIATIPVAAAATASLTSPAAATNSAANAAAPETTDQPLPKFQAQGEEKFLRPDVHAGDRPSGASFASRSAAMGCNGAAGTAHPLATLTAIETLKRGGSAVDAAIAANACLGFLEPTSSGIGGDCYAMIWDPKLSKVVSLAGSAALQNRSRSKPFAPARPKATSPRSAQFPSPLPEPSTPGGPCTSATEN